MTNTQPNVNRFALHCHDGVALRAEMIEAAEPGHAAAVLCHPHPLHGGNMYSHVIGGLFTGLPRQGISTLRFNFRGTSGSEGRHDGGNAERLDVLAAIEHFEHAEAEAQPVILIGYSFGALVSLRVQHRSIAGWIAIAPPLSATPADSAIDSFQATTSSQGPKHIVVGSDDKICHSETLARHVAQWTNTTVAVLPGEDHFLATANDRILQIVGDAAAAITGRN